MLQFHFLAVKRVKQSIHFNDNNVLTNRTNKFTDRWTFERKFVGSCRQIVDLMQRIRLELDVTIWLLHDQKCRAFVSLIAVTSCCNRIRDDNFVFGFAKMITTKPFTKQFLI